MPTLLDIFTGRRETLAEELWRKCGGPGSRRPGPCPKPKPGEPMAQEPAMQQPLPSPETRTDKIKLFPGVNPEVAKQQLKDALDAIAKSLPSVDELSVRGEELLALAKSGKNPYELGQNSFPDVGHSWGKFDYLFGQIFPGGPQGIDVGGPPKEPWSNSVQKLFNKSTDPSNAISYYLYNAKSYWANTNKKKPMSPAKAEAKARAGMDRYKARFIKAVADIPNTKKFVDKMFAS